MACHAARFIQSQFRMPQLLCRKVDKGSKSLIRPAMTKGIGAQVSSTAAIDNSSHEDEAASGQPASTLKRLDLSGENNVQASCNPATKLLQGAVLDYVGPKEVKHKTCCGSHHFAEASPESSVRRETGELSILNQLPVLKSCSPAHEDSVNGCGQEIQQASAAEYKAQILEMQDRRPEKTSKACKSVKQSDQHHEVGQSEQPISSSLNVILSACANRTQEHQKTGTERKLNQSRESKEPSVFVKQLCFGAQASSTPPEEVSQLQSFCICPLTGQPMRDPVAAEISTSTILSLWNPNHDHL